MTVGKWVNINAVEFGFSLDESELIRLISSVSHEAQHIGQSLYEQATMESLSDDNYSPDHPHWKIENRALEHTGKLYPQLKQEIFPR